MTTLLLIHYFSDITRFLFGGFYSPENVSVLIQTQAKEYSWFLKLLLNCFGYSCVILPGYFVIKYVQVNNYLEKNDGKRKLNDFYLYIINLLLLLFVGSTCIYRLVSLCIKGTSHGGGVQDPESVDLLSSNGKDGGTGISPRKETSGPSSAVLKSQSTSRECLKLTWCFSGLMMSYLTWGVLQEKIMTQKYYNYGNGQYSYFTNSQYLVFVNRLLAFLMSLCALQYHRLAMGRHRAPLYKYSYASLSNIMSAWFQYEALKYVNFPTQVLAKSCKIIPVMLMGRLVSRKRYEYYEYFTAFLISLGMGMFMIGSAEGKNREYTNSAGTLTATGLLLLSMYMIFDSFTANWQDNLFREYRMTPLQMMCGVNLFSTLFTAASLNLQSGFMESFQFIVQVFHLSPANLLII